MLMPGRTFAQDDYRYASKGRKEADDELKGDGNSVNYKYRMHDARIGRFFAVDPLAAKYPYYSQYAFSGNRVIDAEELEGLEPRVKNGILYYRVKDGQGPTQIANDINDPETQEKYGYRLPRQISWKHIVIMNFSTFKTKSHVSNLSDKFDQNWNKMNVNPGDILYVGVTNLEMRTIEPSISPVFSTSIWSSGDSYRA
ncbi:MAG: hypothetical protein MK081_12365 [Flavobacteriales bacterium]|nr:hypothetical protein [Flavobacteriales bacterium]